MNRRLFACLIAIVLLLCSVICEHCEKFFALSVLAKDHSQQKHEIKPIPRKYWSIQAYLLPREDLFHYTLNLTNQGFPFDWTVRPHSLKLTVLDCRTGRRIRNAALAVSRKLPDIISPFPETVGLLRHKTGRWVAKIDFRLDRGTAAPGMYIIRAKGNIEAVEKKSRATVKLPDFEALLTIYLPPQPGKLPSLKSGQRFLSVPWTSVYASETTDYRDLATGKALTYSQIASRVLRLVDVKKARGRTPELIFELDGRPGWLKLESDANVSNLPYITPIVEDSVTKKLQAEYNGKNVWAYNGGGMSISTHANEYLSLNWPIDHPVFLRHVERVCYKLQQLAIGTSPGYTGDRETTYFTMNPLVVILDEPSRDVQVGGGTYVGWTSLFNVFSSREQIANNPKSRSIAIWDVLSDRWDFERSYSLRSPFQMHPEWTSKMRKQVKNGTYGKGTTKDMLVWILGWPSIYGTKADIMKLNTWTYDNLPPYSKTYEFRKGRIVSIDEPRLP